MDAKPMKHLELRKIRISTGAAAYFFDNTDYFLLNAFEKDVKEAFHSFWKLNLAANKGDAAHYLKQGIDSEALKKGWTEKKWDKAETLDAKNII